MSIPPQISVVLPTFNEAPTIVRFVAELTKGDIRVALEEEHAGIVTAGNSVSYPKLCDARRKSLSRA